MELFNLKVLLPKEEMHKYNDEEKTSGSKNKPDLKNDLVFSIDQDDKIIKFNKECEKKLGFNKKEILNKDYSGLLIPEKYLKKWKNTIKSIRKKRLKDDFQLPLLTKDNQEIMILWTTFPVKDTKGHVKDIGLVGKLVPSNIKEKEPPVKTTKIKKEKSKEDTDNNSLIKELVEKNLELEKINFQLEKDLEKLQDKLTKENKKDEEPKIPSDIPSSKPQHSFSELLGGKKKKQEINRIIKELEEKRILLEERETQLINEKRNIMEQRNEFYKWREKLELLENELYKREEELKNKEEEVLNKDTSTESIKETSPRPQPTVTTKDIVNNEDFLNTISESAVVLKRGILKQINEPFLKLLGYDNNEIIEKSIFNFIAPEGFQGAESYYLSRIKGENITTYETIFLTKNSDKITVEISNRPTTFNGEKAEIAIIKKINKENENIRETTNDDVKETTNDDVKETTNDDVKETTNDNVKENSNENINENNK
jgi:PAS domain S-box-containing protein